MGASLTYYIREGVLVGFANDVFFHICAASGGGGGSTKNTPAFWANNPYYPGLKTYGKPTVEYHVHGGPIPPGLYKIDRPKLHPTLKLSARLTPKNPKAVGKRDGFLIHGPGPHGSDGCIVLLKQKELEPLMYALSWSAGGTLFVEEAMYGVHFA